MDSKIKLSEAQKQAIMFVNDMGGVSIVNPYPIRKDTISRLIALDLLKISKGKMDYQLTPKGKNMLWGLSVKTELEAMKGGKDNG